MYYRYQYELYHGGPGSGRYPEGSGLRPFQKYEKSRRRANLIKRLKNRKIEKDREEREKKERKEAEEKEKLRKRKEEILTKGNASEIIKLKEEIGLTNQEMREALDRIKITDELRRFSARDIKTGWDIMNDTAKRMKDVNLLTAAGIEAYKNLQTVMKFIDEASKKANNDSKGS